MAGRTYSMSDVLEDGARLLTGGDKRERSSK